jgi:hypothetical protein
LKLRVKNFVQEFIFDTEILKKSWVREMADIIKGGVIKGARFEIVLTAKIIIFYLKICKQICNNYFNF